MSTPSDRPAPVAPPQRDLSDVMAPRLKRVSRPRSDRPVDPPQDQRVQPDAEERPRPVGEGEGLPQPAAPRRRGGAPRRPTTGDPYAKVSRTVYLEADLHALVVAAAKGRECTLGEVVLAAVAEQHTRLADLVVADQESRITPGELWDEIAPASTKVAGPKRALQFKLTNQQLAAIDRLVSEKGATDRSHLVGLALQAHLEGEQ